MKKANVITALIIILTIGIAFGSFNPETLNIVTPINLITITTGLLYIIFK